MLICIFLPKKRPELALPMDCSIGKARQFSPSGLWGRSAQKTHGQGSTVTAHTVDNQHSLLARFGGLGFLCPGRDSINALCML